MKALRWARSLILCGIILTGAMACGNDPIQSVKSGHLEYDKGVTVGNAFDHYKGFSDVKWSTFTTENGRTVVQVEGKINVRDILALPSGQGYLPRDEISKFNSMYPINDYRMVFQFSVNKDNTFSIQYAGEKMTFRKDGKEQSEDRDMSATLLQRYLTTIYSNEPIDKLF